MFDFANDALNAGGIRHIGEFNSIRRLPNPGAINEIFRT